MEGVEEHQEGCQGIDGDSSVVQEDAEVVENSAGGRLAISVDPHCNAWKVSEHLTGGQGYRGQWLDPGDVECLA